MDPSNQSSDPDDESLAQDVTLPDQLQPTPGPSQGFSAQETIKYPSKDGNYISQFCNQPIVTTLNSFSNVANLVKNPYELLNNVDELVRMTRSNRANTRLSDSNFARVMNQNRVSSTPSSPVLRELDTFPNLDQSTTSTMMSQHQVSMDDTRPTDLMPIPALPPIECTSKRGRLEPLTIEEYESKFRESASELQLVERVFYGGFADNQIRAALWPYIFGLVENRGKFEKIKNPNGEQEVYVFVEHEANQDRWKELRRLYEVYQKQWEAILPDQECRFSTFRERKSLIERDVIRCDRLHPFYADQPQNLTNLTHMLMTYIMYDFDIGYVQGMSDLAGPILYMYKGNHVKAFWVFVEVMKLFRRNFELTQKTVHYQLNCLHELIKATDPIFSQYLREHEASNCFFAFRAIVCLFKRELMKEDEADYTNVLYLWDTLWAVSRLKALREDEASKNNNITMEDQTDGSVTPSALNTSGNHRHPPLGVDTGNESNSSFEMPYDPNQSDTPRNSLTDTELFVLSLCLSMIRRERDLIMARQLDGTDIHLHFINPQLTSDLNGFMEHAMNIYSYLQNDFDLKKLKASKLNSNGNKSASCSNDDRARDTGPVSPIGSTEGYDLLTDFLVINGASGT